MTSHSFFLLLIFTEVNTDLSVNMVKLTIDLISRGTSGYTKKKRHETMEQYLRRLTHLYLENKGIDEVVIIIFLMFVKFQWILQYEADYEKF